MTMRATIEEAILEINNETGKLQKEFFANISKKPTRPVSVEDLSKTKFIVTDEMGKRIKNAVVLKIIPFTIYNLKGLMCDWTDFEDQKITHFEACGFEDPNDAFDFFNTWLDKQSDLSFKDTFALYLFKTVA